MRNIKYKGWYNQTANRLKEVYKEDFKLMAGLIASASPRNSISKNVNIAKHIYNDLKTNRQALYDLMQNKASFMAYYKIFKPHFNNILTCINHNFNEPLKLKGLKVYAFYQNLIGSIDHITLDIWMLKYFKHKSNNHYINKKDYIKYSKRIFKMAKKINISGPELQAVLWINTREDAGFKPVTLADKL